MVIVQYLRPDVVFQVKRSYINTPFQYYQHLQYDNARSSLDKISPLNTSMRFLKHERDKPVCSPASSSNNQTQIHLASKMGAAAATANFNNKQTFPLIHCTSIKNIVLRSSSNEKEKLNGSLYNNNKNVISYYKSYKINSDQQTKLNICSMKSFEETSEDMSFLAENEQERIKGSEYLNSDWGARIKITENSPNIIRLSVNFSNADYKNAGLITNNNIVSPSIDDSSFSNNNVVKADHNQICLDSHFNNIPEITVTEFSNNPTEEKSHYSNSCNIKLENFNSTTDYKETMETKFKQMDISNLKKLKHEKADDLPTSPCKSKQLVNKICSNSNTMEKCIETTVSPNEICKEKKSKSRSNQRDSFVAFLKDQFSFITKENVFDVELAKTSRGLGLSICGGWDTDPTNFAACFIRIKRLYPLQPAWTCNKLKIGDVILSVNGCNLTGLTYTEAIEVLRMTPSNVKLTICRPDNGIFPPIPENPKIIINSLLDTPNNQTEFLQPIPNIQYMEFDVTLTKIGGSLGFTITEDEDGIPGHYIKDLIKEPALTCGSLQSGDKIILVNGVDISDMNHTEAIAFFRNLPDEITLCLWRPILPVSSPLSPLSPTASFFNETEKKTKPKPLLRKEALDMLSDKARLKKEKKINDSPKSQKRVHDLEELCSENDKLNESIIQNKQFPEAISKHSTEYNECISPTSSGITSTMYSSSQNTDIYETDSSGFGDFSEVKVIENQPTHILNSKFSPVERRDSDEYDFSDFTNRPQRPSFLDLSSDNLSPRKQMYGRSFVPSQQYDNLCDSFDYNFGNADNGFMNSSNNVLNTVTSSESSPLYCTNQDSALMKWRGTTLNGEDEEDFSDELRPSLLNVELDRRWNSRLGFSLISPETTESSSGIFVKYVYPGSLAAVDGRLQAGDRIIKVNDKSVAGFSVEEVIDLLRKSQGKVILTIERIPDNFNEQLSNSSRSILIRSQSQNEGLLNNEITAMNAKNNNINRCFHWDTNPTSPVDNEYFNSFINLKV